MGWTGPSAVFLFVETRNRHYGHEKNDVLFRRLCIASTGFARFSRPNHRWRQEARIVAIPSELKQKEGGWGSANNSSHARDTCRWQSLYKYHFVPCESRTARRNTGSTGILCEWVTLCTTLYSCVTQSLLAACWRFLWSEWHVRWAGSFRHFLSIAFSFLSSLEHLGFNCRLSSRSYSS